MSLNAHAFGTKQYTIKSDTVLKCFRMGITAENLFYDRNLSFIVSI